MHIFLTGAPGAGKSTVIDATVAALGVTAGGFRSYFGADRAHVQRALYLCPANQAPAFDEAHTVARFSAEGARPLPRRFDALGDACLGSLPPDAQLIVMDECGYLEAKARRFQRLVLDRLDGALPVLGVVRLGLADWTDRIARHPRVRLVDVTRSNRDRLPADLARHFTPLLRAPIGKED